MPGRLSCVYPRRSTAISTSSSRASSATSRSDRSRTSMKRVERRLQTLAHFVNGRDPQRKADHVEPGPVVPLDQFHDQLGAGVLMKVRREVANPDLSRAAAVSPAPAATGPPDADREVEMLATLHAGPHANSTATKNRKRYGCFLQPFHLRQELGQIAGPIRPVAHHHLQVQPVAVHIRTVGSQHAKHHGHNPPMLRCVPLPSSSATLPDWSRPPRNRALPQSPCRNSQVLRPGDAAP